MIRLRAWFIRLGNLFRSNRLEQELTEEIESNLQFDIEEKLRAGMTPEQARRTALIRFGSIAATKEEYRERRGLSLIDGLNRDIRYAVRLLIKSPVFTTVAVLSLMLSIGANTTIFSLINAVFLRPLPARSPYELVQVATITDGNRTGLNLAMIRELRDRTDLFTDVISPGGDRPVAVEYNGAVFPGWDYEVSANFYSALGIPALIGRVFSPADDAPRGSTPAAVAVISHYYWRRRFGGDPKVIGKAIQIEGVRFTIIGVTGKEFSSLIFGLTQHITTIRGTLDQSMGRRDPRFNPAAGENFIIARMARNVTLQQVRDRLNSQWTLLLGRTLPPNSRNPARYLSQHLLVESGAMGTTFPSRRDEFARPLNLLMAVVGIVLLGTCVNLANLTLARAVERQRELSIRAALGAGRRTLIRQTLCEAVFVSALGSAGGMLLAHWLTPVFAQFAWTGPAAIDLNVSADMRVVAFISVVALLVTALTGLGSALFASRTDPVSALQGLRTTNRYIARSTRGFMTAQVALCVVIVMAAGLLVRTLTNRYAEASGDLRTDLLTAKLYPQRVSDTKIDWSLYSQELEDRLVPVRGVQAFTLDMDKFRGAGVSLLGSPTEVQADLKWITPAYFQMYALTLREGRLTDVHDNTQRPKAAVINQTLARRLSLHNSAVGRAINIDGDLTQVIGVVSDLSSKEAPEPQVYLSIYQLVDTPSPLFDLKIQASGDPGALKPDVERVLASLRRHFVLSARTDAEQLAEDLWAERMLAGLTGSLAGLALLLCAMGLYGITACGVSRRTAEIGVRMALGATAAGILRLILRESGLILAVGLTVGSAAALVLGSFMRSFVFGVAANDPATLLLAATVVIGVALAATYIPARRAATVDPAVALKHE